jgi:diphthamide synthase (EF-2-diphthine--ammonia ligase)
MVSVSADGLNQSWLGRPIDRPALDELRSLASRNGMNLAGEGGEYETLVLDSPLHRRAIRILGSEVESGRDSGLFRVTRAMLEDKP